MKSKKYSTDQNFTETQHSENILKQTEDKLRESEQKFRNIIFNLDEAYFSITLDGTLLEHNPALNRILGFSGHLDLRGFHIPDLWQNDEDRENYLKELLVNHSISKYKIKAKTQQGKLITLLASAHLVEDECNRPRRIEGIFLDITDLQQTEERLLREEQKFRAIAENTFDIIILLNREGKPVYANPALERVLGYKPEERIGANGFEFVHPDSMKFLLESFITLVSNPQHPPIHGESRLRHKDGSWRIFETVGTALTHNNMVEAIVVNHRDITKRKQAEELLIKSEERYRTLAENATDAIFTIDMNFNYTYASPSVYNIVGYTAEEVKTMRVEQLVDAETLQWFAQMFAEELETEKRKDRDLKRSRVLEYQHIRKDGSKVWVENKLTFLRNENNEAIGLEGVVRDITDRKKAQEAALKEHNFSRSALDSLMVPFFMFELESRKFFRWNKAFTRACGCTDEEIAQVTPIYFIPESERENLLKLAEEFEVSGKVVFEMPVLSKNGQTTPYLLSGNLLTYDGKQYVVGMGIDITDHKKADELVKQSEAKYRLLADYMKDYVWLMDLNLKINYVSPSAEKLLGYSQEEFKELSIDKFLTPDSFQKAMDFCSEELPKALAAPPDYVLDRTLELEYLSRDGQAVWGEATFTLIRDQEGKPVSILGESRNITERKKIEDELRKSEENFRRSLDDSPLGVRISSFEGETIYANRAILDIYGYESIEELKNTPLKERYTPESYAEYLARKKKRELGEFGPSEYEVSIIRKTGEVRHLYVFRKEIFWNGKKQSQVIYQDITLRRQAEEKLNETLESLRQSIKITIQVLGTATEAKDPYMAGHQKRVADLARAIATEMKLPNDKIEAIRMASAIHDIGKISVPSEILCKPAVLSDIEFSLVKNHPFYSYEIIKEVEAPWPLADIVYQHHERIDGSGYPLGKKNGDILIESRILAVADVVEAMISYRPYRPALELESALNEIEKNAGILYDRDVVQACLKLFREKGYRIS
ncbi:MAG TPA: PAS domain S-box protein [Smithella sp.]|nr:PAS domain S-box protein [Smithella sp.]HOU50783.1 PAS domain S-box protein [Smithella sp.]HQI71933.1 PAS domain S-box protein [Smithella sp.]